MWAHRYPCFRTIATLIVTLMRVGGHGGGYGSFSLVLYWTRAREGCQFWGAIRLVYAMTLVTWGGGLIVGDPYFISYCI